MMISSAQMQQNRTRLDEFNRLYSAASSRSSNGQEADRHASFCPRELFRRKVREGNLTADSAVALAHFLLGTESEQVDMDSAQMGLYCFQKAHELSPYNTGIIDTLMQLKKALNKTGGLSQLELKKSHLQKTAPANGKLKLGIRYLAKGNHDRAEYYFKESCSLDNADIESVCMLADLYATGNNLNESLNMFSRIEKAFTPEHPFCGYFRYKYGQTALLAGDAERAVHCLKGSVDHEPLPAYINLLAETALALGNSRDAISLWEQSLKLDNQQIPLYLKMHDAAAGTMHRKADNIGQYAVNILIYTYNKLDMIRNTLQSLAATDIGTAGIFVLENHCTDGTREFLESAQQLFPNNRLTVINLPTNIGAPAARNWLLAQQENKHTDFLAYLDDDVILPRDWLSRLIGTMEHAPEAGVAGAKVINQSQPKSIQYIHRYLDTIHETRLILSSKHPDEIDFGQFDYVRKCLSVMGCCHLLRTSAAKDVGEFDIRFSPSQIDDIDHDIMTCQKGYEVVYNGYLEVVHCQKAGKEAFISRPSMGNIIGNDCKFAMKHTPEEMLRVKELSEQQDKQDIAGKIRELRQMGLLSGVGEVPFDIV